MKWFNLIAYFTYDLCHNYQEMKREKFEERSGTGYKMLDFSFHFVRHLYRMIIIMNENTDKKIIGTRILQRRKQIGIKQSELAERLGISVNQMSNIENGKSSPKFSNFLLMCDILDCNADYFIAGLARKNINENLTDMISSLTIDEQRTLWILLDCYIHRKK